MRFFWATIWEYRFVMDLDVWWSLGFCAARGYISLFVFSPVVDFVDVHDGVKRVFHCMGFGVFPALHLHSSFSDFSYRVTGCYCRQGDVCWWLIPHVHWLFGLGAVVLVMSCCCVWCLGGSWAVGSSHVWSVLLLLLM